MKYISNIDRSGYYYYQVLQGEVVWPPKENTMFFGQFNTDYEMTKYFDYAGTGIEVGAALPVTGSNSYHFEQHGWQVLCVEANPALIRGLQNKRKNVIHSAVGAKNEDDVDFHVVTLESGDVTAISGLKLDKKLLDTHPVANTETIKVNVRTLDTLLEDWGVDHVDFASIDTEGTELDVLKGFDLDKWQPYLLVIENNHEDQKLRDYLAERAYHFDKRVGVNDFFVRGQFLEEDTNENTKGTDNDNNALQQAAESTENNANNTGDGSVDSGTRSKTSKSTKR